MISNDFRIIKSNGYSNIKHNKYNIAKRTQSFGKIYNFTPPQKHNIISSFINYLKNTFHINPTKKPTNVIQSRFTEEERKNIKRLLTPQNRKLIINCLKTEAPNGEKYLFFDIAKIAKAAAIDPDFTEKVRQYRTKEGGLRLFGNGIESVVKTAKAKNNKNAIIRVIEMETPDGKNRFADWELPHIANAVDSENIGPLTYLASITRKDGYPRFTGMDLVELAPYAKPENIPALEELAKDKQLSAKIIANFMEQHPKKTNI